MTWGIDLSNHNPGANLAQVKADGCSLAYLKASEGIDFTDGLFAGYRRQAMACGLPFGAYHFAHPQPGRTPDAEVAHFLAVVRAAGGMGQLRPMLDLEWTMLSPEETTTWALRFMSLLELETGVAPGFYSYPGFLTAHVQPMTALARFPLWLAAYQDQEPPAPYPWPAYAMWQHTSTATVPGVPGFVDRSVTTPSALSALRIPVAAPPKPAPAPAPKPTPPPRRPPVVVHGGGTVLGSRVLVEGDHGDDVGFVQRFLGLVVDKAFGPITFRAVEAYQAMRHLGVDGKVGPQTWRSMIGR